jgi:hypothetical protein
MQCRFSSCSLLIVLLTAVSLHAQQVTIPPVPQLNEVGKFVHDKSGLLMPAPLEMRRRVFRAQKVAFEDHRTPIILVTIHHMAVTEDEFIDDLRDQAVDGLRTGSGGSGLIETVQSAGKVLAEKLPLDPTAGPDEDELSNRVILIHPRP